MKTLIIGGAGFVGRNLVGRLLKIGCECTVVDDDSGLGRVRALPDAVRLFSADAASIDSLSLDKPDFVYYLAARVANLSYSVANQAEMMAENLRALLGLRACYALHPRSVVYVSSTCVYPAEAPVPTPELWGVRGLPEPTNRGYAAAKRIGEQLAGMLHCETGIPTIIARPFNIYGPWDLYDRTVGHFIPALLRKMFDLDNEITIWGGPQKRAFTYVDDVVECLIKLSQILEGLHVVNVGRSDDVSVADVASALVTLVDFSGKLTYSNGPIGYSSSAASEEQLKQLIGAMHWTTLDSGLRQTIEWCFSSGVAQPATHRPL